MCCWRCGTTDQVAHAQKVTEHSSQEHFFLQRLIALELSRSNQHMQHCTRRLHSELEKNKNTQTIKAIK